MISAVLAVCHDSIYRTGPASNVLTMNIDPDLGSQGLVRLAVVHDVWSDRLDEVVRPLIRAGL